MSPEQFHDALNYLEDDLIAQTDELRQGKRVLQTRPTARQIIPWVASAACLALVIGMAPQLLPAMETGNFSNTGSDQMYQEAEQAPLELEDYLPNTVNDSSKHFGSSWYPMTKISHENLSMYIVDGWTYEVETNNDGSYYILITPPNEEGAIRIGYDPNFGVCGTGLTEKQTTVAGMDALAGYYHGSSSWSFIAIRIEGETYVIQKDSVSGWWSAHGNTVMDMLDTIVIG